MSTLLEIRNLSVRFETKQGSMTAVDHVSLQIPEGTSVGLVGESGSGKSTLARAIVGLVRASEGEIVLRGEDIAHASQSRRRQLAKRIQMVFQDPYTSLNPRMTVGETLLEALQLHGSGSRNEHRAEVRHLLETVGLDATAEGKYPAQFSGGQRQRVAIARALAVKPELIIADEVTSALDVSVQASILNLLREVQAATGAAMLFISHNLAAVRYVSDRIVVMHSSQVVEEADAGQLFTEPGHPYTEVLIGALPTLHRRRAQVMPVLGDVPDPYNPPSGCRFHTRCPVGPLRVGGRERCLNELPLLERLGSGQAVACHYPLAGGSNQPAIKANAHLK